MKMGSGWESDDYSLWHDYSNPQLPGPSRTPEDTLDPDRPVGSKTEKEPLRKRIIRWFRDKK